MLSDAVAGSLQGKALELQWIDIHALDERWRATYLATAPALSSSSTLALVLAATWTPASLAPPSEHVLSLPSSSLANPEWTLETGSAGDSKLHSFRVHVPQQFIEALSGPWPSELFAVELTLRPRQHATWGLSCRLAFHSLVTSGTRTRVQVPVFSRSDRVSVGRATIAVAVAVDSSPPLEDVMLDPKPSRLQVNILQIKTALPIDILGASKTVALHVWLSAEHRDSAAKSPPFVVSSGEQQHGITFNASLTSQDASTDVLCFAIEDVNSNERRAAIAMAECSVPSSKCLNEAWIDLKLVTDDKEQRTVCGGVFFSLQCSPIHVIEQSPIAKLTAVSLLGEAVARAAQIETKIVRGSIEIELRDANVKDDAGRDMFVQLEIAHSRWSARSAAVRVASDGSAVWLETFRVPIVWSTTDRVVPSLHCSVVSVSEEEGSAVVVKKSKQLPRLAVPKASTSDRRRGATVIDLPVFFAHPSEWATMAPRLRMQVSNEQVSQQVSSHDSDMQLKIRVRFVPENFVAPRDEDQAPSRQKDAHGHLAFSCFKASGAFLQRFQSVTHQTELRLSVTDTLEHENVLSTKSCIKGLVQKDAANGSTLRWEDASLVWAPHGAHCTAPPLLWLRLQDDSTSSVIGETCVPVFPSVLHSRHVVSFSLPIVSERRSAESDPNDHSPLARRVTKPSACSRWRQGTLAFEMQFIDGVRSQPQQRCLHVLVHELDQWRGAVIPSLCRMISFRVSLNDASSKELWSSKSGAPLQVPTRGDLFPIEQSIDLTAAIPLIDDDATKHVLVIQLHDVQGQVLSHAMVHLRGGLKKLGQREKNAWHNLYTDTSGQSNHVPRSNAGATGGRIRVSIIDGDPVVPGDHAQPSMATEDVASWLVCEVVSAMQTSLTLLAADVWISACLDGVTTVKTLQSTAHEKDDAAVWQWRDPYLMIPIPKSRVTPTTLELEFVARVDGTEVHSTPATLSVERVSPTPQEEWLTLVSPTPNDPIPILVNVRLQSIAMDPGTLVCRVDRTVWLRSLATLSVPIDAVLIRVTLKAGQQPALSTAVSAVQPFEAASAPLDPLHRLNNTVVQLPVRLHSALCRPPELLFQLVSTSTVLGELCLGETTMTLASLVHDVRSCSQPTRWLTLRPPHESSSAMPTATIQASFSWRQQVAVGSDRAVPSTNNSDGSTNIATSLFSDYGDWQRGSVAVLTIWKKLFYTLDDDRSGRIDLREFRTLFAEHADVFSRTSDGALLFRILMNTDADNATVTPATLDQLFQDMDVNNDQTVEWSEYVDFLQRRLDLVAPSPPTASSVPSVSNAVPPAAPAVAPIERERERRRKRREDPHASASSAPDEQRKTSSVRRPEFNSDDSITQQPLHTKVASLETALQLERQRNSRLREDLAALQREHAALQRIQEKARVQEEVTREFLRSAVDQHDANRRERDATRQRHTAASIVLQSKLRMRLHQKRFQALKWQRNAAALRLQCWFRQRRARRELLTRQAAARDLKRRMDAAQCLQRVLRLYVRRQERQLLAKARAVSATLVQALVRRYQAQRRWRRQRAAVWRLQCWLRQWLARRAMVRLRLAQCQLRRSLRLWVCQRRWRRQRESIRRLQRWWSVMRTRRDEWLEREEAALCLQSLWRGLQVRRQRVQSLEPSENGVSEDEREEQPAPVWGDDDDGDECSAPPCELEVADDLDAMETTADTNDAVEEEVLATLEAVVELVGRDLMRAELETMSKQSEVSDGAVATKTQCEHDQQVDAERDEEDVGSHSIASLRDADDVGVDFKIHSSVESARDAGDVDVSHDVECVLIDLLDAIERNCSVEATDCDGIDDDADASNDSLDPIESADKDDSTIPAILFACECENSLEVAVQDVLRELLVAIEDAVDRELGESATQIETVEMAATSSVAAELKCDNATPVTTEVIDQAVKGDEPLSVSQEVTAVLDALIASISSDQPVCQGGVGATEAAPELGERIEAEARGVNSETASEPMDVEQLAGADVPSDHIALQGHDDHSSTSDAVLTLPDSARSTTDSSLFAGVDNSQSDALSDSESMDDRDSVASADLLLEAGEVATFASDAVQPTATRRTTRQSSKRQFAAASARRIDSERLLADVKKLTASDDNMNQV